MPTDPTTYRAILEGDRLRWQDAPPSLSEAVAVTVTVPADAGSSEPGSESGESSECRRRRELKAILDKLVELNPFRDIEDPVAWQREIRKDRPLPGREDQV